MRLNTTVEHPRVGADWQLPIHSGPETPWMEANAPLIGADVVLWYVFSIHHITRPEDWPVMPADTVGSGSSRRHLRPQPSLDLVQLTPCGSRVELPAQACR
jgi:hypothetical protein